MAAIFLIFWLGLNLIFTQYRVLFASPLTKSYNNKSDSVYIATNGTTFQHKVLMERYLEIKVQKRPEKKLEKLNLRMKSIN